MVESDGLLNNSSENELVTKQRLLKKKDATPTDDISKTDVIRQFFSLPNFERNIL